MKAPIVAGGSALSWLRLMDVAHLRPEDLSCQDIADRLHIIRERAPPLSWEPKLLTGD